MKRNLSCLVMFGIMVLFHNKTDVVVPNTKRWWRSLGALLEIYFSEMDLTRYRHLLTCKDDKISTAIFF
jgi:hypothetical protein